MFSSKLVLFRRLILNEVAIPCRNVLFKDCNRTRKASFCGIQKCICISAAEVNFSDRLWPVILTRLRKYAKSTECKCWKCGSSLNTTSFSCQVCGLIQKPDSNRDLYDILGIQKNFDIDGAELTKKFRELQSVLHPDKFSNSSKEEQQISEDYSSLVNKAYSTLQNPLSRGLYLLHLNGISIEESNTQLDVEFLAEIMERNEELEEVTDLAGMAKFNASNKKILNNLIEDMSEAFKKGDYEQAKAAVIKMKYYSSIDQKVREKKQSLGIPD